MGTQQELERYRNDAMFIQEHRDELLRAYPEEWIAVLNTQVIGHAGDLPALLQELDGEGYPRGEACIKRLTASPRRVVVLRL